MKNYIEKGERMTVTATAAVNSGDLVLVEVLPVVAITSAVPGEQFVGMTHGVFSLAKASVAIKQGEKLYWDATAKVVTNVSTSNTEIGHAFNAASISDAEVELFIA